MDESQDQRNTKEKKYAGSKVKRDLSGRARSKYPRERGKRRGEGKHLYECVQRWGGGVGYELKKWKENDHRGYSGTGGGRREEEG